MAENQKEVWVFVHFHEETFKRLTDPVDRAESLLKDPLTGLFSHLYFKTELKRLDTERQLPLSIVMADLNYLKLVNDAFGHHQGDLFLREAAKELRKICRKEDIIARIGGDEFVILLPKTSQEQAEALMKRFTNRPAPSDIRCPVPISLAWGIATKKQPQEDIKKLLKQAEQKMYHQKTLEKRKLEREILELIKKCLEEEIYSIEPRLPVFQRIGLGLNLADTLGLSLQDKELLAKLLIFYDIGKLSIPSNMFEKATSELSPEDWQIIREHPERGYRIASQLLELAPLGEFILSFRERWDGKGYPQGLKGEEIPLLSRVASVISAYEAMVMGRPYRLPLHPQQALEELKKHSGSSFDPQVVAKFVEMNKAESFGNCLSGHL